MKRKVIAITDGDLLAEKAVEEVAHRVGGRFITCSAGNPTPLSGFQLVEMIKMAPEEPVLVLFDDRGHHGVGKGEEALTYLAQHEDIDLLGVVAVASNIEGVKGTAIDYSITKNGQIYRGPVDKKGTPVLQRFLTGDTVSVLSDLNIPIIIGTGDTGKMAGLDAPEIGAPITLKAVQAILANANETKKS